MIRSTLAADQTELGARWTELGEWEVVADYGDEVEEYGAATRSIAVRDISHFGFLEVSGADHVDLLHRLSTNEMRHLHPGQGLVNVFTTEKGRIVDRVVLLKFGDRLLLLTSPGKNARLLEWIEHYTFVEDVKVNDRTGIAAALQILGPDAPTWLERNDGQGVGSLDPWHFLDAKIGGTPVLIIKLEDLRVPSYAVLAESSVISQVWETVRAAGVRPMGESAYDILRVESGWGVYGHELSEERNPLEAGQMPFVSFTKGCYIGQEVVARLDTYDKVQRVLVGFELDELVQVGSPVVRDKTEIGRLTSVVRSPGIGKVIALGYIRRNFAETGGRFSIGVDGAEGTALLVELPFVGRGQNMR